MTGSKSYSDMLKGELLVVARRLGLTNLSRLRKDEIIDLIKKATRRKAAKNAKKTTTKKATARKATTKKSPTKKATTRKATTKKSPTKKATTKKATTKKATTKKATTKKATTKKATTKKATKKATAKKTRTTKAQPTRSRSYRSDTVPQRGRSARAPREPVSAQAGAVASKYNTSSDYKPEELQGIDEHLPELPESYGDNRIVLLPRDPAWMFAYWSLTYEYKEAARAAGGRVLALRLYDVTDIEFDGANANAAYEHECAEWARSWYLPVPAPARDYVVEIGYRGGDDWFPLARSKRVAVPVDQPSTWTDGELVTIGFDEDLRAVRNRLPATERPDEPPASFPVTPQTIYDDGELRILVGGAFFNPSGVPSWPMFSHAVLGVPGSLEHLPGSLEHLPGSLEHLPGSLGHLPGSLGHVPGSLGHPGQIARHPGTGGVGTELDGQVFAGQPVVLEDLSQPMLQAAIEMVISGRSYPGTEISIAGRCIPTGPDGAFSLRVSVPDGLRDLPIEARSLESGVVRRLMLRFGREFEGGGKQNEP